MRRALPLPVLLLQLVLLGIELFTRYDTAVRQAALALTNVLGTALLLAVAERARRAGGRLPLVVSLLAVSGIWFDAAGNFAQLYARIAWWDKLAHAVGTGAVAAGLWVTLQHVFAQRGIRLPRPHFGLYIFGLTMLLAVVYEVSEYLGDLVVATRRVTDRYDTADDLLYNALAALLVVWLAPRLTRTQRPRIDPPSLNR